MPELAWENVTFGIVVERDDDEATFEADSLTDEDILAEFNHSDANVEKEDEMDNDEIVIVDELPKPPTQCELRHAISVLNTFSFFADDVHLDNLRKSTRNISQIIDQSFSVAKRQQVTTNYFSWIEQVLYTYPTRHVFCYVSFLFFKYSMFCLLIKVKIYIKKDVSLLKVELLLIITQYPAN